jgi:hypothetical protein
MATVVYEGASPGRHPMQAWRGWTATAGVPTTAAPTWAEWCVQLQSTLRDEQRRQHCLPFTERELARLSFVRWLYQTGRLDLRERDNV